MRFYLIFRSVHGKLAYKSNRLGGERGKTMKCKYCEAEMADWGGFCPVCGKNNSAEEVTEEVLAPQEDVAEQKKNAPVREEEGPSPQLKKAKRIAAMSGCVALLAVLATVLFFGIRGGWDPGSMFSWLMPRPNTVQNKDNYTVEDKKMEKKADVVVATMGEHKLTNAQLQIFYWNEVYTFLNSNSYYLSYLGLDYTKPLNEQTCFFDANMTWQQYFLESAIQSWQSNVVFVEEGKAAGYVLPDKERQELDKMPSELETQAKNNKYESVDAMVQEAFGSGVTLDDYMVYMELQYYGVGYFAELYEKLDPTMEQLEAYYNANAETLNKDGVKKDGSYTVDVRHILVMIDNIVKDMEKDSEGTDAQADPEITEEHWAACLAAAEKIYEEWKNGDMTETHFGELANKYSHDQGGKVTNGGIYTYVKEGQMVAEFNDWCFDENRKPGDTGLVKTKFGYHIMYFVGSEETWIQGTRSAYLEDESNKIVTEAMAKYEMDISYKKIVLADVKL